MPGSGTPAPRRVWGVRLPLGRGSEEDLRRALARGLGVRIESVGPPAVVRRSLDARDRRRGIFWVYTLDVALAARPGRLPRGWRLGDPPPLLRPAPAPARLKGLRAAVVGTGPAGLFAALALARSGAEVTVLEQGPPLRDRVAAVGALWREGSLSPDANVQFGEGGAGTFSDGKLVTRVKDPRVREVLEELVRAGAPGRILEEAHPHVGTDGVRGVVEGMRGRLEALGVRFRFRARVTGVCPAAEGYRLELGGESLECKVAVLAVGHSSRSLFRRLLALGLPLVPKGFAAGVRVEHPQAWVDRCQYGRFAGHPDLPPAEYFLTHRDAPTGRGVYSFCMCPGGVVVNSSSEPGLLVTNGMSMSQRASGFANAGIVVTVEPSDLGPGPLAGFAFQEELERRAFELGGGGYRVPAQRLSAFLGGPEGEPPKVTYRPGARRTDLRGFFPSFLEEPLRRAFIRFERLMPGFVEHGVVMAPETRTSCPVQVRRAEDLSAEGFPGLYLAGEGAGWAGGIVSSAVDALRCVEALGASWAGRAQGTGGPTAGGSGGGSRGKRARASSGSGALPSRRGGGVQRGR